MIRVLRHTRWAIALIAMVLFSCDQPPASDLYGVDQAPGDDALRELRGRQFLTYRIGSGASASASLVNGAFVSMPTDVWTAINNECRVQMWLARNGYSADTTNVPPADVFATAGTFQAGSSYCTNATVTGSMANYFCSTQGFSCQLQLMMDMAESTGDTELTWAWTDSSGPTKLVVSVLGSAERAAVAEYALSAASNQAMASVNNWFTAANMQACTNCTTSFNTTPTATTTLANAVPMSLALFYDGVRQAARLVRDRYTALADEAASSTADRTQAGLRSMTIRALGATMVRGYATAYRPPTPTQTMLVNPLSASPANERARSLILETALPPSQIFALPNDPRNSTVGFTTAGFDDATALGYALARYNALRGTSIASTADLLTAVGSTMTAFGRARAELADRFFLFRRSTTQLLPDRTNPAVSGLYAASGTMQSMNDEDWPIFSGILTRPAGGTAGIPGLAAAIINTYRGYVNQASPTAAVVTAMGAFRSLRNLAYGDGPGKIAITYASPTASVDVYYDARTIANDVLIIANSNAHIAASALRCATQGENEGQPCSSADIASSVATATSTYDSEGRRLFQKASLAAGAPLYVLVRREDWSPDAVSAARPGAYVAVYSGMTPIASGSNNQGTFYITPRFEEMAGRMMAPSIVDAAPAISCASIENGETPLVLESTATATQNGEEDSWRQYLTLARQAADEADLLGEQTLSATIEANTQAEGSLQELQQLCGVDVDLETLRAAAAGNDPIAALTTGSLSTSSDDEIRRLRACVSTDASSVQPQLSLGSEKICVWTYKGNSARLCERAPGEGNTDLACPRIYDPALDNVGGNEGGCRVPTQTNTDYRAVWLDQPGELLAYVSPLADPGATPASSNTVETTSCLGLRQFLAGMDSWASANGSPSTALDSLHATYVRAARYLEPRRAEELARGIRWEAVAGGYSRLYINDRLTFSTGTATTGTTAGGLCAGGSNSIVPSNDCTGVSSLLCTQITCDETNRLALNRRLLAAAMMARWMGGQQLQDFVVPYFQDRQGNSNWTISAASSGQTMLRAGSLSSERWCEARPASPPGGYVPYKFWNWGLLGNETTQTDCAIGSANWRDLVLETLSGDHAVDTGFELDEGWADAERQGALTFLRSITAGMNGGVGIANTAFAAAAQATDTLSRYEMPTGYSGSYAEDRNFLGFFWCPKNDVGNSVCDNLGINSHAVGAYYNILHASGGWNRVVQGKAIQDAMELLCEADRTADAVQPSCRTLPTGASASNLDVAATQVNCLADAMRRGASLTVFANVPRAAVDAMRQDDPLGTQTAVGGDFAQAVIRMRIAMQGIQRANEQIAFHAESLSRSIKDTGRQIRVLQLQEDSQRLAMLSRITSLSSTISSSVWSEYPNPCKMAAGAIQAADAVAQIAITSKQYRNQRAINDQEEGRILIGLEQAAADRGEGIKSAAAEMRRNQEEIDAAIHQIVQIRMRAQQLLRSALYMSGSDIAPVMATQVASRQRLNTSNVRYRRAFQNAVRLADLARRAIEQRFAVRLANITQDLQFVEAPALWSSRLCAMTGINYDRIVAEGREDVHADYADQYIGDYVRNLEQFVLSYGFAYPNSAGTDTAVVSLRDDVLHVRDRCPTSMNNALARSNDLTAAPTTTVRGWSPFGCVADGPASEPGATTNCVMAERLNETWPALDPSGLGVPQPFRVTFGAGASGICTSATCSWQAGATLGQSLALRAGNYRVSWYARAVAGSTVSPDRAVRVVTDATPPTVLIESATPSSATVGTWTRYWFTGSVGADVNARVEIQNFGGAFNHKVDVAGLMIERVEGTASVTVPAFIATNYGGTVDLDSCEDTDGDRFRGSWKRDCEPVYLNGVKQTGQLRCYRKIIFAVSDAALETGQIFRASGFASGNFNYRNTSLGVNVVGTAARECVDPALPSTCYSAGFIPFTLTHAGPYQVRSYDTTTFNANLYPAQIHNARALAAERYITNPISGADQALISQYTRREFDGRPLTGTYELRIYEEPGVNFDGIEDVQLVLGYEYWTRSQQLQ